MPRRIASMVVTVLCSSLLATAQQPGVVSVTRAIPNTAPTTKSLLTQADFTEIGTFKLPSQIVSGSDPINQTGFTLRRQGTQLLFYSAVFVPNSQQPFRTYEGVVPTILSTNPATAPTATVSRVIGVVERGEPLHGLRAFYWDEQDQRLYWSGGDAYNATRDKAPNIGYSTLTSFGGATPFGPWNLGNLSSKWASSGIVPIPKIYADRLGGKRLAGCCGGYWSAVTTGPGSMGPSLIAFDPRVLATIPADTRYDALPQNTSAIVPATLLLAYPFSQNAAYTDPQRSQRDTNYRTEFDGWQPRNGVGYYTWTDEISSAAWIETATRKGVICFPNWSTGRVWYENSDRHAEGVTHAWQAYDPEDLMLVASGSRKSWEIQARASWLMQYSGITYPLVNRYGSPAVVGVAFDEQTSRLYLVVNEGLSSDRFSPPIVHVYRVAL